MDFKDIQKLNFNINLPENKKADANSCEKKQDEKALNVNNSPVNPHYWQNKAGIKPHNLSFKGNNSSENQTENYIQQIKNKLYFLREEEIKSDLHRKNISLLSQCNEKSAQNYVDLITRLYDSFLTGENQKNNYINLVFYTLEKMPDIDDDYVNFLSHIIYTNSTKESSVEIYKMLIDTLGKQNAKGDYDTLLWLNKRLEYLSQCKPEEIDDYMNNASDDYEQSSAFLKMFTTEKDKEKASRIKLTTNQTAQCNSLVKNGVLTPEIIEKLMNDSHYYFYEPNEKIGDIIDKLYEDEQKGEILKLITSDDVCKEGVSVETISDFLDFDVEFFTKTISKLQEKKKLSKEPSIFINENYIKNFFRHIKESNLEEFLEDTKDLSAAQTVAESYNYINPKTNLYDSKIKAKKEELDERGMYTSLSEGIAIACVDLKTGELSPIADEFLDFALPYKENSFKDKFLHFAVNYSKKAWNVIRFKMNFPEYYLAEIINSIKKADGSFDRQNLLYIKKFMMLKNEDFSYDTDTINELMNMVKDDEGVIIPEKYREIANIQKITKTHSDTVDIYKTLNSFPPQSHKLILFTCKSLSKKAPYRNFKVFSDYLFTKEGKPIDKNLDYIKQIYSFVDDIDINKNAINMIKESEDSKRFIIELLGKTQSYSCLDELAKIYNKYKGNGTKIPEDIKNKIMEYAKKVGNIRLFDEIYSLCITDNNTFNDDLFNKSVTFLQILKNLPNNTPVPILYGKEITDIINHNLKLSDINFKDKVDMINMLKAMQDYIKSNDIQGFDFINSTITDIDLSLNMDNISLPIDKETKIEFISNILTAKSNGLSDFEKLLQESVPQLEKMTNGINITYPREEFLSDLTYICRDEEIMKAVEEKTGIIPTFETAGDEKVITGYNGIIKLNELNVNNPKEKRIYDLLYRFMYENKAETGNKELDKYLNYIIKACPEFINIIGKKQHGTHKYTLDVHSLLVMAYSICNPNYLKELNETDRSLLKLASIFHDITKTENSVDKGHQNQSSLYARSIIKKFFNNPEQKDRLYEIIQNHHWLEEYSTTADKDLTAKKLAFNFRRPNDFEIAKIMADSDLKAVSEDFYNIHKDKLSQYNLQPLEECLNHLYATGNAVFTDYFISDKNLRKHKEQKSGREYTVINFHNIEDTENLAEYGFNEGLKKKDVKFLVHMVNDDEIYNSLQAVKLLSSPYNGGVLSESIITPEYKRTYANRKYGLLLSQINTNVISMNNSNQGSGIKKGLDNVLRLIYNESDLRLNFKKKFLKNLDIENLKDEDYINFYKNVLASKTSLQQINPDRIYNIGQYEVKGEQIIEAIKKYQDDMVDKEELTHNEIVGYTPKIQGVIAKAKSIKELSEDILKFAYENNYPIVLI